MENPAAISLERNIFDAKKDQTLCEVWSGVKWNRLLYRWIIQSGAQQPNSFNDRLSTNTFFWCKTLSKQCQCVRCLCANARTRLHSIAVKLDQNWAEAILCNQAY